ncbi:hypothetical protein [Micromonospora chersina]
MTDLTALLEGIFSEYGDADGHAFRLAAACYPDRHEQNATANDTAGRG